MGRKVHPLNHSLIIPSKTIFVWLIIKIKTNKSHTPLATVADACY